MPKRTLVTAALITALAFWPATSNKAEAQSGGPGNAGRGGGGHDKGAWQHCISSISTVETSGAINAALSKLNARGAGHHYTLVEVISCGVHAKKRRCKESGGKLYAFRFIVEDDLRGVFEKNVKVCY